MNRTGYRENVVSATELLKAEGLYDGYEYAPKPSYYLTRGDWVGTMCDLIADGHTPNTHESLTEIDRNHPEWPDVWSWINFVSAYTAWKEQQKTFGVAATQLYVWHKAASIQGTLDQLLWLSRGLTIVDIKTVGEGQSCAKATALQLAAYHIALHAENMQQFLPADVLRHINQELFPVYLLGLALRPDGTFKETWYDNAMDCYNLRMILRGYYAKQEYR
jgi:hypothetical protein